MSTEKKISNPFRKFKELSYVLIGVGIFYSFFVGVNHLVNRGTEVEVRDGSTIITKRKARGAFSHVYEFISEDKNSLYHSVTERNFFGSTKFTRFKAYNSVSEEADINGNFSAYMSYKDGGIDGAHDGLVDRIIIIGKSPVSGVSGTLYRDKHYNEYKEEFDEGDRVLAEAKENFKHYFEEDYNL